MIMRSRNHRYDYHMAYDGLNLFSNKRVSNWKVTEKVKVEKQTGEYNLTVNHSGWKSNS